MAKSKVNEAVHAFLLVLCTSHRYGVIFKDPLGGLSTKQNSLMETVLDSLVRPWDHSYASELVLKICRSCPDLVKKVWNSLRESLEPRWTDNWLSSMKFANLLLDELQPECMELAVNNLNVHQVIFFRKFAVSNCFFLGDPSDNQSGCASVNSQNCSQAVF